MCKVMCECHKALRPADGTGRYILQDRKGVRCVRYLSSGRDCGVHAAATGSGQTIGTQ